MPHTKKPPRPEKRRSKHHYRKLFMDRYIHNQPPRGLGLHRLPRLGVPRRKASPSSLPPGVWALLMVALVTFFFICVLICLLILNFISI